MQVNCLLFPSPRNYQLDNIRTKIILIPKSPTATHHLTYVSFCCGGLGYPDQDQFEQFLNQRNPRSGRPKTFSGDTTRISSEAKFGSIEGGLTVGADQVGDGYIPCLFIKGRRPGLMVFFHANGEDISTAYQFLAMVNAETNYSILAMEYPGYSVYAGSPSPADIQKDADRLMKFLQLNRFTSQELVVFGRSIGCAVALTVTHRYQVYCSVMLSPFLSLRQIAQENYGTCAGKIVKQAFQNEEHSESILSPVLIIHGANDTLVPYSHSLEIASRCKCYCRLKVIDGMTHTRFNFRIDFINHLNCFLKDIQ